MTNPITIRVAADGTRVVNFFQEFQLTPESLIVTNESSNKPALIRWSRFDTISAQIPPGQFRAYDGISVRWMEIKAPDDGAVQVQWIGREALTTEPETR